MATTTPKQRGCDSGKSATPTTGENDTGLHKVSEITIAGIEIRKEESGLYCLNDLHRAAGGEAKHRPAYWLENKQTMALVAEMSIAGIPAIQSKQGLGTFVAKELVYAYAMWISAAFNLKVIRAYDALATRPAAIPQTFAEALRLAADKAEQLEAAEKQLAIAAPKVEFVNRYVESDGLKGFRQVSKLLNANERDFRNFLNDKKIMYRLGGEWVAYQDHIDAGWFEVRTGEANEHAYNVSKFTPKGVTWIAALWKHCGQAKLTGAIS